jgi:nucleotide-binding universal stress UspA family protein
VAGPIVVGFDGHEVAERALERAIADAKTAGVELVIVVVDEEPVDPIAPSMIGFAMQPQPIPLENQLPESPPVQQLVDEALDRARAAGVSAQAVTGVGDPMREIVAAAQDNGASSVVLGTHHYNRLQHFLGEDVAAAVRRRVECEVITVE